MNMVKTSRRDLLAGAGALLLSARAAGAVPVLTDDGTYREDWFIDTFLELADDLDASTKAGKRFVVMWELKGCPYCRETHFVNFARPDISQFVRANFEILPLNIIGSRKVTDFDGEVLAEKQLAAKYGVRFTPTIQFFPETFAEMKDKPPREREIIRIPGYLKPDDFLDVFRYVEQKSYATKTFRDFLKSERS